MAFHHTDHTARPMSSDRNPQSRAQEMHLSSLGGDQHEAGRCTHKENELRKMSRARTSGDTTSRLQGRQYQAQIRMPTSEVYTIPLHSMNTTSQSHVLSSHHPFHELHPSSWAKDMLQGYLYFPTTPKTPLNAMHPLTGPSYEASYACTSTPPSSSLPSAAATLGALIRLSFSLALSALLLTFLYCFLAL